MNRAKRRDANESSIVQALEAVGCAVQRLNEPGCPDLLVSRLGVLTLVEVKLPLTARGAVQKGRHRAAGGEHDDMTPAQVKWWREWKGKPPIVVRTVDEALAAIGAVVSRQDGNAALRSKHTCVMRSSSIGCPGCAAGIPYPAITLDASPEASLDAPARDGGTQGAGSRGTRPRATRQ